MEKDDTDSSFRNDINTGNDTLLDESSIPNNLNHNRTVNELEDFLLEDHGKGNEADNDNSHVEEGKDLKMGDLLDFQSIIYMNSCLVSIHYFNYYSHPCSSIYHYLQNYFNSIHLFNSIYYILWLPIHYSN